MVYFSFFEFPFSVSILCISNHLRDELWIICYFHDIQHPCLRRVDPYGFERPQDFDYESHEEMMSEYLAVLRRRSVKWSKLLHGNVKVEKNIKGQREGCAFKHFTRCCTSSAALALFFLPPSCLLSPLNCLCLSSPSFSHARTHTHIHHHFLFK